MSLTTIIIIAVVIGLVTAFAGTASMRAQLKTIKRQQTAAYYETKPLELTVRRDIFLYKNVVRTEIPRNDNNGHR